MRYAVSISYSDYGENEECVRERARKLIGCKAAISISVRQEDESVLSPRAVCERFKRLRGSRKESFVALALDTQNRIIKSEVISVGTLNASIVHPREVFNFAIQSLAASIIVAHNHPSGSLEPSDEDVTVTRRLRDAGLLLGINVLDHVIITKDGYRSFKESGVLL